MRGKVWQYGVVRFQVGITPAYAGKSRRLTQCAAFAEGSPPRMRGKGGIQDSSPPSVGITPAYAGKSTTTDLRPVLQQDHPRVCGEKHTPKIIYEHGKRITPAYAGKRLKRSRSTVPPVAIVPLFPSVCNKPVVSDGSPAGRDAPLFLPAENAVPASPAYNLRSL